MRIREQEDMELNGMNRSDFRAWPIFKSILQKYPHKDTNHAVSLRSRHASKKNPFFFTVILLNEGQVQTNYRELIEIKVIHLPG